MVHFFISVSHNVNALAPFASPVLRLRQGLQMVAKCYVMRLNLLLLFSNFLFQFYQ